MHAMFGLATAYDSPGLAAWDTSRVTSLVGVFSMSELVGTSSDSYLPRRAANFNQGVHSDSHRCRCLG